MYEALSYGHSHSLASNSRISCSRNVPRCLARATLASCRLLSFFFLSARSVVTSVVKSVVKTRATFASCLLLSFFFFSARSVVTSVVKSVAVAKSVVVKSVAVGKPVVKAPPPSYAATPPLAAAAARAQQQVSICVLFY